MQLERAVRAFETGEFEDPGTFNSNYKALSTYLLNTSKARTHSTNGVTSTWCATLFKNVAIRAVKVLPQTCPKPSLDEGLLTLAAAPSEHKFC